MEEIFKNKIEQDPFLEGPVETDEKIREELRSKVEKHYQANNVPENLIKQFVIHNDQVEYYVNRFSREEEFNKKETEIALLSAILHDIAKGYGDFLNHGEEGGKIAKEILIDMGISEALAESVRLGIKRHMGREGYPTDMAKKKYGDDFEYPKYATKVGKMIFECDILTQLTKDGFNKILLLRETDKENRKEDEAIAKEKNITREKAAIFSVLESAKKSYDLIEIESIKKFAGELWQKIQEDYEGYFGDGN